MLEDRQGKVISESNTTPETIIQQGWDRQGDLKWSGIHPMSAGFTGLKYRSNLTIYTDYTTKIQVPAGYTGGALVVDPQYNGGTVMSTKMIGGLKIEEQGGSQRNWDGFKFNLNNGGLTPPATLGTCFCNFGYVYILGAKTAVAIDQIHADGWLTSCKFECITVFGTRNGVEWRNTVGMATQPGVSTLNFDNFWWQSSGVSEYGVKNMAGNNHVWNSCAIWDVQLSTVNSPPDAPGANMHSSEWSNKATNQLILGGILMHWNVVDNTNKGQVRWIDGHGPPPQLELYKFIYQTNGSSTGSKVYTIPHGMGLTPDFVHVAPASPDAATSQFTWTKDSTNITVTYLGTAPPPWTPGNQNNVKFEVFVSVK